MFTNAYAQMSKVVFSSFAVSFATNLQTSESCEFPFGVALKWFKNPFQNIAQQLKSRKSFENLFKTFGRLGFAYTIRNRIVIRT